MSNSGDEVTSRSLGADRVVPGGARRRAQSANVRIDAATNEALNQLAESMGITAGRVVALAVRSLLQERMGEELRAPLTSDETFWLDADFG